MNTFAKFPFTLKPGNHRNIIENFGLTLVAVCASATTFMYEAIVLQIYCSVILGYARISFVYPIEVNNREKNMLTVTHTNTHTHPRTYKSGGWHVLRNEATSPVDAAHSILMQTRAHTLVSSPVLILVKFQRTCDRIQLVNSSNCRLVGWPPGCLAGWLADSKRIDFRQFRIKFQQ